MTLVKWNARFLDSKWFRSEHPDVSRGRVAALDVHNVDKDQASISFKTLFLPPGNFDSQ